MLGWLVTFLAYGHWSHEAVKKNEVLKPGRRGFGRRRDGRVHDARRSLSLCVWCLIVSLLGTLGYCDSSVADCINLLICGEMRLYSDEVLAYNEIFWPQAATNLLSLNFDA